jgi:enoyl-CoA hydratase
MIKDDRIKLAFEGHLATITIARPDRLNALDLSMIKALEHAAHEIDATAGVRAAIITGEGEKSFCAGGDIKEWSTLSAEDFAVDSHRTSRI